MSMKDWISATRMKMGRLVAGIPGAYPSPDDDFWYRPWGPRSYTGVNVTRDAAVSITAIDACVSLISDTVASLPMPIYQNVPDQMVGQVAEQHPVSILVNKEPNSWQAPVDFWSNRVLDLLFWGNGYAEGLPAKGQRIGRLNPLRADCMEVKVLSNGSIGYKYREPGKPARMIDEDVMFHIRSGHSIDGGITGQGVMHKHPPTIGLVVAIQTYAQQLYGQGTLHQGVLQHPGPMGDESMQKLRKQWMENQGLGAAGKPLILEEGMTWANTSMTPEDAQVLDSRKFHVEESCRMFRVPPHLVGHTEKNSSWGTGMADLTSGFLKFTLRPWLTRVEQAVFRDLITVKQLYYPKYHTEGLLRADSETRYKVYAIGKQWGILTSNEIRAKEDMPPIDGGDTIWQPVNMQPAGDMSSGEFALGRQFIKDTVARHVANEVNWLRAHFNGEMSDHERISKLEGYFGKRVPQMTKHLHISESDAEEHARYAAFSAIRAIEDGQEAEMAQEWARTAERRLMSAIFRTIQ